jgi:hypothetical protein
MRARGVSGLTIFVADRWNKKAPMGLLSTFEISDIRDPLEFLARYDIVRFEIPPGSDHSWRSAMCSCSTHTASQVCHHVLGIHETFGGRYPIEDQIKRQRMRNFTVHPLRSEDLKKLTDLDKTVPTSALSLQIHSYIPREHIVSLS